MEQRYEQKGNYRLYHRDQQGSQAGVSGTIFRRRPRFVSRTSHGARPRRRASLCLRPAPTPHCEQPVLSVVEWTATLPVVSDPRESNGPSQLCNSVPLHLSLVFFFPFFSARFCASTRLSLPVSRSRAGAHRGLPGGQITQ